MKVLKLDPDTQRFSALAMVHEPDIHISFSFDGTSLVAGWRPYSVRPITEEAVGEKRMADTSGDDPAAHSKPDISPAFRQAIVGGDSQAVYRALAARARRAAD